MAYALDVEAQLFFYYLPWLSLLLPVEKKPILLFFKLHKTVSKYLKILSITPLPCFNFITQVSPIPNMIYCQILEW